MKKAVPLLLLTTLLSVGSNLMAREGPNDALGIDPARIDEIVMLVEPHDAKLKKLIERSLPLVNIHHQFRVRSVEPGPVEGRPGFRGEISYSPWVDASGLSGGVTHDSETGEIIKLERYQIENPVIQSVEVIEPGTEEVPVSLRPMGKTIEKIVHLTYEFAVIFSATLRRTGSSCWAM